MKAAEAVGLHLPHPNPFIPEDLDLKAHGGGGLGHGGASWCAVVRIHEVQKRGNPNL